MKKIGIIVVLLSMISCEEQDKKTEKIVEVIGDPAIIHYAIEGDLEKIKECIVNGADVNAKDKYAELPPVRHLKVAKYLIKNAQNANDNNVGLTVLMWTSQYGHAEVVKYLVENGADINTEAGASCSTALMIASSEGYLQIVKYLVKNGADINAKDVMGYTAYGYAVSTLEFRVAIYLYRIQAQNFLREKYFTKS